MTIVIYSLVLIWVGYLCRGEAKDSEGYFLAGRRLSALLVGMTLTGAAFGGSAILVASQLVYTNGLAGVWFSGSVALGFAALGFFFARRIRESGAHSLADFIGRSHGPAAQRLASALIVVVEIAFFGLTVKSFALMTTPLFGEARWLTASPAAFMALITAVFVVYTLTGGHKAVAATDFLQLGIIFIGLLGLLLPLALWRADWRALPTGFLSLPFSPKAGPVFVLNMIVLMGLPGVVGGDVFSKMLSARDAGAARRGALLAAAAMGALAAAIALLALCARAALPGLKDPQVSVLLLGRAVLPTVLFEIVSLAFLSALLSTGDSVLITGATVLVLDVFKLGGRVSIWTIRAATLALAAGGLALALYFTELLDMIKFSYTLLTASVVMPVLFTLIFSGRRAPTSGFAVAAIVAGLAAASAWKAAGLRPNGVPWGLDPATAGAACSAAVMLAGCLRPRISTKALNP